MSADQESNSNTQVAEQSRDAALAQSKTAEEQPTLEPVVIRGNVFGEQFIATPQATLIAAPTEGTLLLNPDGSFDFDPGASKLVEGEVFSAVFRYQFRDENGQLVVREATLVGTTEQFEVENQPVNVEQLTSQLRLLLEAYDDTQINLSMRPEAGVGAAQLQTELSASIQQHQVFDFVEFSFRSIELTSETPVEDIVAAIRAGAVAPPEGGEILDQSTETEPTDIASGPGDDIIVAGTGGDTVVYEAGQGNDTVDGGEGFDLVTVDLSTLDTATDPDVPVEPANVSITAVNGNVVLDGGDFELTLNGVEEILLTGGAAGGRFVIGDLTGTDIADDTIILRGGDGALEVINQSDRSLEVSGTPGADTLTGGSSTDLLVGFAGNDSLSGGAGNDTLGGGEGTDTLDGGAGDDRLDYTIGDVIRGGTGTDTLQVYGNTLDTARLVENGVSSIERIEFISDRSEIILVDLESASTLSDNDSLRIDGGSGDQVFITSSEWGNPTQSNGFQVYTASNGFTLEVQSGITVTTVSVDEKPANPSLPSVPQNSASLEFAAIPNPQDVFADQIGLTSPVVRGVLDVVLSGNPVISGLLDAVTAFNQIAKAFGNLASAFSGTTVYQVGSNTADRIDYGSEPENLLPSQVDGQTYVNALADIQTTAVNAAIDLAIGTLTAIIRASVGGPHIAFGGGGNDSISSHFKNWDDYLDGGAGADTLSGGSGNDVYVIDSTQDVVIEGVNDGTDSVVLSGTPKFAYTLADNVENLFNVTSFGAAGNALNNYIEGDNDGNAINGAGGNDTINGRGGNDLLDGGAGSDLLFGGAGDDAYNFDENDVIYENANAGTDTIRFQGTTNAQEGQTLDLVAVEAAGGLFGTIENITLLDRQVLVSSGLINANFSAAGNSLDNRIQGNSGNNLLQGRDGDDTLLGGEETLNGVDGFDTLEGGAGDDTYLISDANDVIFDISGNDTIRISPISTAVAGTDPTGQFGGQIITSFSDVTLTYFLPTDSEIENLILGTVTSFTTGVANPNNLTPSQDLDAVGGLGNNKITGNAGNNTLTARGGNDTLVGGEGNDTLSGDSGSDTTAGAAGSTSMEGGEGNDTYIVTRADDVILELAGEGTDTVSSSVINITLPDMTVSQIFGTGGTSFVENLQLTGSVNLNATGNNIGNSLQGNDGNNVLAGGLGADTLRGGAGDDLLVGGPAKSVQDDFNGNNLEQFRLSDKDQLFGGEGSDTLQGGADDDTYFISDTDDVVVEVAGEGTDTVSSSINYSLTANVENLTLTGDALSGTGNDSNNVIIGTSGSNTLDGGAGADTLQGGEGDDIYIVDNVNDVVEDLTSSKLVDGNLVLLGGTDLVKSSVSFTLSDGVENLELEALGGDIDGTGNDRDNVIIGSTGNNALSGGGGADSLQGFQGDDTLSGGDDVSVDTLNGGLGNDTYILSGSVEDVIIDVSGNDTIEMAAIGRVDAFQISGAIENITLRDGGVDGASIDVDGNAQANRILGNGELSIGRGFAGNDTITGGATVIGDEGNDVLGGDNMYGGSGDDVFQVTNNTQLVADSSGTDTVESSVTYVADAELRAQLIELLDESESTSRATADLLASAQAIVAGGGFTGSKANQFLVLIEQLPSISVDAIENITLTGDTDIDATGNSANNTIVGNDSANKLEGGAGNDTLTGNGGNDTLDGGEGADQLTGGLGDDTYLTDGLDTVVEAEDGGSDTVQSDQSIDLSSFANVENATLEGNSNTSVTGNASGNVLTGNSGNNTLSGGSGADTLIGGLGNDTYVVNSTDDSVVEQANQGTDTVQVSRTVDLESEFANIENATLTDDVTAADLSGDSSNNVLTGNSSANTLDGRGGNDTLVGGEGGDTYLIDSSGDVVSETGSSGTDTVNSSVTYTLGSGLENLRLLGADDIDATGNSGNNALTGNGGDNVFVGGGGNNTFTGGAGDDTFTVGTFDSVTEVREFRLAENQTLLGSIANLFDAPVLGPNDTITYELGGEDRDLFNIDANGLVTFIVAPDFENPTDDGADNTYNVTITATQTTPGVNRLPFGSSSFSVKVTDEVVETINVIAGAGNEKITQLVVDGTGTQYAIVEGGDIFTVTTGGEIRFISAQQFVEGADPLIVKVSVTQNSVTNIITQAVSVTENPDGRVDNINRVKSVNVTPLEDVSSDTIRISDPTFAVTIDDEVENLILDSTDGESLAGNDRDNVITGNTGNDTIDGKAGDDTLKGGAGDDTYTVDAGDVIEEMSGQGTDTVNASASYALSANLENLTLTGTDDINGTGNSDANFIDGNSGDNVLNGGGGNDTLQGRGGDDTYVVNNSGVTLSEGVNGGTDVVQTSLSSFSLQQNNFNSTSTIQIENLTFTGTGNNSGTGNDLNNTLTGNAGNDTLDGGSGNDTLIGGAGNDRYTVDSSGDVITENASEGTDEVLSKADSYTLGANIENLSLLGSEDIDGTGNDLNNYIEANAGANELRGLGGDDLFGAVSSDDTVDGGEGLDLLNFNAGGVQVDFTTAQNLTSVEGVFFQGGGNKLTADETSINNIAGGTLYVAGESTDQLLLKGGWTKIADNSTVLGLTVDIYQFGSTSTQAIVQDGIDVRIVDPQASISVNDLDGTNGFVLTSDAKDDWRSSDVSSAGDLDGDGFSDLVVGVSRANVEYGGEDYSGGRAFVVFGDDDLGSSTTLNTLDGTNGFSLAGYNTALGSAVSGGDFNGDGVDDLLVGDYQFGNNYVSGTGSGNGKEGINYVVFGVADNGDGSSNFAGEVTASDLRVQGNADGAAFRPFGEGAKSGQDVASIGDFNGDGIDDFVVSGQYKAHDTEREGSVYIVFGDANGFDSTVNIEQLDGTDGLEVLAAGRTSDQIGARVATAGDINGDGFDDVIFGPENGSSSFVVLGTDSGIASLEVDDLDGTNGFELNYGGAAIAGGGDINGDGFDDLVIGTDSYGAFVLFGASDMSSVLSQLTYDGDTDGNNLFALNPDPAYGGDGSLGFHVIDEDPYYGSFYASIAMLGDINGDGFDDFMVADYRKDLGSGVYGEAFVIFGGPTGHDGLLNVSDLDGTNGFKVTSSSGYYLGASVGAAGDVNGDGFDDIILSEKGTYNNTTEVFDGKAYVIYGKDFAGDAGVVGDSGNDSLVGGTDSVVRAGAGDDVITVNATDFFRIDGGGGSDTLALDGSGLTLNFDNIQTRAVQSIETIDLTGSGDNTLTIDHLQAGDAIGSGLTLQVNGNAGDVINLPRGAVVSTDGSNNTYTRFNTTISIANTITVNQIEFAPQFFNNTSFTIDENTTFVTDLTARDKNGDNITYSITGGDDQSFFAVDATTGELRFSSAPNFENAQSANPGGGFDNEYVVVVTATDDSGSSLATNHTVTVTVADVEDAPVITTGTQFSGVNGSVGGLLGITFTATDEDSSSVTFSISGDDADKGFIVSAGSSVPGTYNANLNAPLGGILANAPDADGDRVYEFVLTATDAEGNQATQNIEIGFLEDANRLPQFDVGNTHSVTITEGTGVDVGIFTATDFDNALEDIRYTLADDQGGLFAIDAITGALTFTGSYDDVASLGANTYALTLEATDNAGSGETGTSTLTVTVAFDVPTTTNADENALPVLGNFTTDNANEILDFSTLLSGATGLGSNDDAFKDGYLNFRFFGSDIIVEFDADGGGDEYLGVLRVTDAAGNLDETDTDFLIL